MPNPIDPSLQAGPSDKGLESLQKVNRLLFDLYATTNPDLAALAPTSQDDMSVSLQKINAISYQRAVTGGDFTEAPMDGAQYVRQNGAWVAIKPPPQPFAPVLTSIMPNSVPAGSPDTVITFTGTGFVGTLGKQPGPQAVSMQPCFGDQLMSWYTQMVSPLFISDTQFQATLGANLLANPTSFFLWIQNTGGPDTNSLEFDVT